MDYMGKCNASFQVEITYTSSDGCLTRYFVYISGEHIEVAQAEVNALVRLLGLNGISWRGRVGFIDGQINPVPFLLKRAALVKEAGIVLAETTELDMIESELSEDVLRCSIASTDTFSVRTLSLGKGNNYLGSQKIESGLGAYIKQATGAGVSLDNPQSRILVIQTPDFVWVCLSFTSELRPNLRSREPGRKPFFHPSMMNATLARVMCNLAGVVPGEILLDPFCGGGGILCEASLIGAKTVGIDLNWRLLTGGVENLAAIGNNHSFIQGDVRNLPIGECDCIVTDPPYGRASSTRGALAVRLVESLLGEADSILRRRNESLCICGSSEMNIQDLVRDSGLVLGQMLHIRVHSGLVREVLTIGF
jgi:tRNA (guanine10-N2)-dimethyltransferase